jgi:tyrosinase
VVYNQRKWPLLNPDQALSSLVAKARATPSAVSLLSDVPVPAGVSQALASAKLAAPAASAEELEAARRPVEAFAQAATSTCTNPEIHREWRTLTSAQKGAYVNAMKCLFGQPSRSGLAGTRNRWDDLVAIHQLMSNIIHEVGQFLPWHRYFLKILETEMRNTCGYTGPMSWWDETMDAGDFHNSPVANPNYFGYLVPASDHCLKTGVSFSSP